MSKDWTPYEQGAAAYQLGATEDCCPYPKMTEGNFDKRVQWFKGYFDQRTGQRLAKAFAHYGIQWP